MSWKHDFKSTLTDLDTPQLFESLNTYLWGLEITTVMICLGLCLMAANYLSKDAYGQAFLTFVGSIVVGISPYLATMFFYS